MTANVPTLSAEADRRSTNEAGALLAVVLALMAIGIITVFSASRLVETSGDGYHFGRHLIFVPVALAAMVAAALVPYRWLASRWVAVGLMAVTLALLVAVLIWGEERNYARRWFAFTVGGLRVSFQPSELAKVALVVFLAWYYTYGKTDARRLVRGFLVPMGVLMLVAGLVAKEDFGTAALIAAVGTVICLVAGVRLWHLLLPLPVVAAGFYVLVYRVPYRWERLVAFTDPWGHQDTAAGWHVGKSLLAIGRGGLSGVGLGAGVQKHYIPERSTDFIFSVLCEEMGLLGGILVIGLFGVLVWRAGRVIRRAPDRFAFLLATGLVMVIVLQAIMNIGVATAALPAKGISLPFISYGGSGLVFMSAMAGLLASIAWRSHRRKPALEPRPVVYKPE